MLTDNERQLLDDLVEYLEGFADTDFVDGEFHGNEAMGLLTRVRAMVEENKLAEVIRCGECGCMFAFNLNLQGDLMWEANKAEYIDGGCKVERLPWRDVKLTGCCKHSKTRKGV